MATREEILVGYQLIRKANFGNWAVHDSSVVMQGKEPVTLEAFPPEIMNKKTMNLEGACTLIRTEVGKRLGTFLKHGDMDAGRKGLKHFRTGESEVRGDHDELVSHEPSIGMVNALLEDPKEWKPHGELLSLYKERVELDVVSDLHIPEEHARLNAYQNVLNALAYELQGTCNFTGKKKYTTREQILNIANQRITVLKRATGRCSEYEEGMRFISVANYVELNLDDAKTVDDLSALGKYIDDRIAQLPILWRWWAYGS
jgi:hypothetical protein